MRKFRTFCIVVALVVFVPAAIYVGTYMALLDPPPKMVEPEKGNFAFRQPRYRFGGEWAKFIFTPLSRLDQRMRPKFWYELTERGKLWAGED